MSQKLDIKRVLPAVDQKDYNFYENLTEEERKAFSPLVLMRFTSNVKSDRDIQEWFIETTNEFVNKHHWQISKHRELMWKLYAATGIGQKFFHQYLAIVKKDSDPLVKKLEEMYPTMKLTDLRVWASIMTKQERWELLDSFGLNDKEKKAYLKND